MVVVQHTVAVLTFRVDEDFILKKSLGEGEVEELNESLTIVDEILL